MKHQLLIGINYFGTDAELAGCVNDIEDVEKYVGGAGFEKYAVLLEDTDALPTRAGILDAMKTFAARPDSYKYVHFSGHGSQLKDTNRDEIDGMDECICPLDIDWGAPDNNFIRDDELYKTLVKPLPASCKLVAVFDSCHSGSALDLPFRCSDNGAIVRENASRPVADVIFISGCRDNQTSADARFGGKANGALTKALLTALAGRAAGEQLTWRQLIERMRAWLRTSGYDQVPQLDASKKELFDTVVDI